MQPGSHQLLPRASPDHKRVAETQGAAVADAHGLSASAASLSEMIQQSPGHGSTLVSSSGAFPIPTPGPCGFLLAVGAPRCRRSLSSHPALAQPEAPLGCVGWSRLAFSRRVRRSSCKSSARAFLISEKYLKGSGLTLHLFANTINHFLLLPSHCRLLPGSEPQMQIQLRSCVCVGT